MYGTCAVLFTQPFFSFVSRRGKTIPNLSSSFYLNPKAAPEGFFPPRPCTKNNAYLSQEVSYSGFRKQFWQTSYLILMNKAFSSINLSHFLFITLWIEPAFQSETLIVVEMLRFSCPFFITSILFISLLRIVKEQYIPTKPCIYILTSTNVGFITFHSSRPN